jgi:hypothetical protein
MRDENVIQLFSEDEVRRALALATEPESAAAVAAQLYSLRDEEQALLEWMYDTLLLLSCLSDEVAERVVARFATSTADAERIRGDQARYRAWLASGSTVRGEIGLWDVVHDTRDDASLASAADADRGGALAWFTESELRRALELIASPERAAALAGEVYAIPDDARSGLLWTDFALGLLATSGDAFARRVVGRLGGTAAAEENVRQMRDLFHGLITAGDLSGVDLGVSALLSRRGTANLH